VQTEAEELRQGQIAITGEGRGYGRLQTESADPLLRAADRHIVEDRFREGPLEIFGCVEGWDSNPMSIGEWMETSPALPGIELHGSEPDVVAPDERTLLLPREEERQSRG
jgi:hypothetical protein